MELVPLYNHANAVMEEFSSAITKLNSIKGATVKIGPLKRLYRLIEKMLMGDQPEMGE